MAAPFIQTSFAKGEISPSLWGHVDLALFHTAASTLRNMFVSFKGGAYSRAGTHFVGQSKQRPDLGQLPPRIINWDFNLSQGYIVEFGDGYARLIFQGGYVTENPVAISAISQSSPCLITTAAPHGYATGDWIFLTQISGPLALYLENNTYIVGTTTTSTFTITDLNGVPIDSTSFPAYAGGAEAERIYTLASPYAAADLPYLKFDQSADVMSLTCVNPATDAEYPPYDLKRFGPNDWTLTQTSFGTAVAAPASISATATVQPSTATSPPTLPCAYAYQVTAIDAVTGQESQPSPIANITNGVDMSATAGSNVVDWGQVSGARSYNIYRAPTSYNTSPGSSTVALPVPVGSLFGFVGSSFGNQFVDSNIVPDFTTTPPQHQDPFARGQILQVFISASSADWTGAANVTIMTGTGSGFIGECIVVNNTIVAVQVVDPGGGYLPGDTPVFSGSGTSAAGTLDVGPQTGTNPAVVSYFQQRRVYTQTLNAPDEYWMSQPGAFTNFDSSLPTSDGDAISGTPWSEKVNGIQWMLTMPLGLLTFTGSGVWQVGAPGSFASSPASITPSNQIAAPQSSIGSSATVPPIRVNWDVLYLEYMNSSVLDLSYQIFFNIYAGTDISWASSHLLEYNQIIQWAYARTPYRVVWAVRDDGILLSLTYVKEQEVVGWARHDTQGLVRSIAGASENPVDATYLVVERPVAGGLTRFFVERMDNRLWQRLEDSWCVDAAVATVPLTPNATLFANSSSGFVGFEATAAVFASTNVGQTLRMGGGICVLTAAGAAGGSQASGNWILPPTQLLPNDPNGSVIPQQAGSWSIAGNVTQLGGLTHLVGRQVVGLADGVPVGPLTVSALGIVTLPFPASLVVLGLGFTAQTQSVYLDTGQPTVQGRRKAIYAVTVRCEKSALSQVGANQADASALPTALFETWPNLANGVAANVAPSPSAAYMTPGGAVAQPLFTGDQRVVIPSAWQKPGQVAVQQTLPLPLNITALVPELLPGDTPEVELSPRQPQSQQPAGRRAA